MFLPPIITPFICSRESCAASGISYSTKANPLCFCITGSQDMLIDLIGPNGRNACLIVSSFSSKLMLPTYTLQKEIHHKIVCKFWTSQDRHSEGCQCFSKGELIQQEIYRQLATKQVLRTQDSSVSTSLYSGKEDSWYSNHFFTIDRLSDLNSVLYLQKFCFP